MRNVWETGSELLIYKQALIYTYLYMHLYLKHVYKKIKNQVPSLQIQGAEFDKGWCRI